MPQGFKPDLVIADHAVSGVSARLAERPEGRRLFDLLRSGDVLVVRWVDRLGRNYADVCDTIRELMRRGVTALGSWAETDLHQFAMPIGTYVDPKWEPR
jgi:DNA invertase Pin-like site-specific DNA recombinase